MKIYTKTGDKGQTSLLSGNRVSKYNIRIEAYGTVDELNSFIGFLRSLDIDENSKQLLILIQNCLFSIGSTLSLDENINNIQIPRISESDIEILEKEMDRIEESVPKLKNFLLPGGHVSVGMTHICRSVCRRAERLIVRLSEEVEIDKLTIIYINRLSDYFFMLSRKFMKDFEIEEVIWKTK
jgi:cob(I)alamin adenosyltransferase